MGKVAKQSLWNSANAYLGVLLGAFNGMYLFPRVFLNEPEFYGEINTLLATATIISSFSHLGFPISIVTFLPKLNSKQQESFWTFSLVGSFISSLILSVAAFIVYQYNPQWMGSVGYLLLISLSMMLFEVFASVSQHNSKVIFPQFLKNTFRRVIILIALILAAYGGGQELFYIALGIGYVVQLVAVIIYALPHLPKLNFNFGNINLGEISKYGFLVMLASASILIVSKIDILMIRSMLGEAAVAFYSIAFFIGSVVAVPVKSIIVSIRPFMSKAWARDDRKEVDLLYKKSALTQLALTGFLFLIVWSNFDLAMLILPYEYRFDGAATIVFFIGLSEIIKGATGTNGMILTVANKQAYNFYSGLLLIILTILGNWWLIPKMGIIGAALASLLALSFFNFYKIFLVHRFYKLLPFTKEFWIVAVAIGLSLSLVDFAQAQISGLIPRLALGNAWAILLLFGLYKYTKALDDFKIFKFLKP